VNLSDYLFVITLIKNSPHTTPAARCQAWLAETDRAILRTILDLNVMPLWIVDRVTKNPANDPQVFAHSKT
jgi:hypothetical protein